MSGTILSKRRDVGARSSIHEKGRCFRRDVVISHG